MVDAIFVNNPGLPLGDVVHIWGRGPFTGEDGERMRCIGGCEIIFFTGDRGFDHTQHNIGVMLFRQLGRAVEPAGEQNDTDPHDTADGVR